MIEAKVLNKIKVTHPKRKWLLKMLIKMKSPKMDPEINYIEFCKWFGSVIEPVEAFIQTWLLK